MVKDGLKGHVCLRSYLVSTDYLEALGQSFVDFDVLFQLSHVFLLLFHLRQFLLELCLELGVDLCQSKIDDHAAFGIGVIEEVAGLDVSMVNAQILEVLEPNQQLVHVVLHLLDGEGVEEGLLCI